MTAQVKVESVYRLTYVNVPLLLRAVRMGPRVGFYGGAGPEFGVMFSSRAEDNFEASVGGFEPEGFADEFDLEDVTQRVDFRGRFVAGVQIPRPEFTGFVEVRYSVGFAQVYEEPPTENSDVRNHILAFVAGVTF